MLFRRRPKVPPPRPPDLPFDDGAQRAIGDAMDEARAAHATRVQAEHLLSALLRAEGGIAARAVARLGFSPEEVRLRVERASPRRSWGVNAHVLPFGDDFKGAIEFAMREGRAVGAREAGTGELLLGVAQSPMGVPVRALPSMGISIEALRSAVRVERKLAAEGERGPAT